MLKKLKQKNVAILVADGFEKIELTAPMKALKAEGAKVEIISLRSGKIRGMNLHEPAGEVEVSKTLSDANPAHYDALFIPGGFINPDLLRQSAEARAFVIAFDEEQKPIASLCHGPWVLASAGILRARTLTSWPGIRDDLVNAGATWLNQEVVRDGNLVTSRGPQDIASFTKAMIELFTEEAPIASTMMAEASSSSQMDEPPKLVLKTMKWLPRPSFRSLGVALVALGALGLRQKRS